MKKIIGVIAIVLGTSWLGIASGGTLYVDASVGVPGNGSSWETAFQTIQEGIDAASEGDTVIVAEGIYVERVHFNGKNIVLRSTDPLEASVVDSTIIDGNYSYPVVTFSGTEGETCVLSGFTIRNGGNGGGICGGDSENRARATIQNNAITNNNAAHGAGIAYCDGAIQNNIITGNKSWNAAGGLTECDGVIQNNTISGNQSFADVAAAGGLTYCNGLIQNNVICGNSSSSTGWSGGGLAYCHGTIQNNTISGNSANGDGGGGLYHCNGAIQNNVITQNSTMRGGALVYCDGTIQGNTISQNEFGGLYNCGAAIQNNLITANSGDAVAGCIGPIQNNTIAKNSGWALRECGGMIVNCIIWGNTDGRVHQLFETANPVHSCIEHWAGGGEGNISLYPHFVHPEAGDYHLQSWSPCIDNGYPASDFSNEPEPNGGRVNIGAYGNTSGAASKSPDTDADGLPDDWEMDRFGNLEGDGSGDADGDGIPNITEYRYGWDPEVPSENLVENLTKGKWYQTIQVALDESDDGDEIVVHPGVYEEKISFWGKNVVLRSTDPSDTNVVAATVINGGESGPTVTFVGTEDQTCVLSGFTIRHSEEVCDWGNSGGICGGTEDKHSLATIRNNVITNNEAQIGAGLVYCDGTIEHNTITDNGAWGGAGLAHCDGTIRNNTITDNSAIIGGGLWGCGGTIENNIISDNMGHGGGGGLSGCGGLIQNNVITGNWTEQDESAGGGLEGCNGTIRNNIISDNRTRCDGGGGLSSCGGTIENNLIIGNWSDGAGGGLSNCNGEIVN
ncbi:right-handed parallel beta-helix repeat-containing protein, partial [bacterium]|nr:right-handed parallel beta-helix repeat-containing protein [bacterium]